MASRINFSTILRKYTAAGKADVRLTPSTLFLTKPIVNTQASYRFDVLESETATLQPDEIRLNINDEFIITHLGLYLVAKSEVKAPTEGAVFVPAPGIKLFTYAPIENYFGAIAVQNFYAGKLQIAVNNVVYLDKWDSRKHEYVPRTQYDGQLAGTSYATQGALDFSKNAMIAIEPMLTLSGAKKNSITLDLPSNIDNGQVVFIAQDGYTWRQTIDRVGLMLRGLNAQNAASFQR